MYRARSIIANKKLARVSREPQWVRSKSMLMTSLLNAFKPQSALSQAIKSTTQLVQDRSQVVKDPISIVSTEMSTLAKNIANLVGRGNPLLSRLNVLYSGGTRSNESQHLRPLVVLTLSKALAEIKLEELDSGKRDTRDVEGGDKEDGALAFLHSVNPAVVLNPLSRPMDKFAGILDTDPILPKQRRLAEIVEMIFTASLLHEKVVESASQGTLASAPIAVGNKMAILAGDFLLGRASVAIARLRNAEVIELLSTTIANLVEGEFMQLEDDSDPTMERYITRTYLKTASLMSKSCRAAGVLAGARQNVVEDCYTFGKCMGLSLQIVDDINAYLGGSNDLKLAPVVISRELNPGVDISEDDKLRELVASARGVEKARGLAKKYGDEALESLKSLPESETREALVKLINAMLEA